jgi:aminopeptidase N
MPGSSKRGRLACSALRSQKWLTALAVPLAVLVFAGPGLADRPFAPPRDYDLQHSTIRMSFDTAQRKIFGDVTHRVSMLRDGADRVTLDSVGLRIDTVTLDGAPAHFETTPNRLEILLSAPARRGDVHSIEIRYDGSPRQGMFFILPDKNYPDRPREIWTQGEAEDTRFYLPTYDYPNDRLTTDTYLTVPAGWQTISNGRLDSKSPAPGGQVVWHWVQDAPLSTYLISIVAGEFDHTSDTWRGIPISFYAPHGRGDRIPPTFEHTRAMLDFFSATFGVPYPWPKYSQAAVDEFTEDGMENTSATTLTTRALINPALAPEQSMRVDDLISHELAHQWFGDLVTCKDWTNLWLNEGFATVSEYLWEEHEYGHDEADFTRWNEAREWLADDRVYSVPIVNSNFTDSMQYAPNVYAKAGLVLYSLRQELGPAQFYAGLKHYLEKYRGRDVVTADLVTALDESTSHSVDRFFQQWIYGAGAPRLDIQYTYDDSAHQVRLEVKQVQKIERAVGLFTLPTEVEITTTSGAKRFPIVVSKQAETFSFPADGPPLLVLFDPGDTFLDAVHFDKSAREWLYQLRHAATVPDRADAAAVLGELPAQDPISSALAEAARTDRFWGVRAEALDSLAKIGGSPAREAMFAALEDSDPRVAATAATLLRIFPHDEKVAARLEVAVRGAKYYRTREAALISLGHLRSPNSFPVLLDALHTESPDDGLRRAALIGFGHLSDPRAIPIVLDWTAPGRPLDVRAAAIRSLGVLDRGNPETTRRLLAYVDEPIAPIRRAALSALEQRADASAIAPLEAVLTRGDLSDRVEASVRRVVAHLRKSAAASGAAADPFE